MSEETIAYRYATAIFELVTEGEREHVGGAMKMIGEVLSSQESLMSVFTSPVITIDKKESLLLKVLAEIEPPSRVADFMRLLVRKHRMNLYATIIRQYDSLLKEASNIVEVHVRTAFQLTQAQEQAIQNKMQQLLHRKVMLTIVVDESLIAGIAVRVKDEQYEYSLRNDLGELGRQLSQVS